MFQQSVQLTNHLIIFQFDAFYALNGIRLAIAILQGVIAIIASVMACRPLCCNGTQVRIDN